MAEGLGPLQLLDDGKLSGGRERSVKGGKEGGGEGGREGGREGGHVQGVCLGGG